MTNEQYLKNLEVPVGIIDAVLDTDAYNEIDDQYAISQMLLCPERINLKAIYAAPFLNPHSTSPKDGMEKSYNEILKLLPLLGRDDFNPNVYKGSEAFLTNEKTPIVSAAAKHLVSLAKQYSPEKPLYVVAIAAITNVASALLIDPSIAENIVVVWLGGHSRDYAHTKEFNLWQDVAAARVVMGSGAPFVQLPCCGVVSAFTISKPELELWLIGKTPISNYLAENTIDEADNYCGRKGKPWTRPIWDVTASSWLLNDNDRFMLSRVVKVRLPEYNGNYSEEECEHYMRYVFYIKRDALMEHLIKILAK